MPTKSSRLKGCRTLAEFFKEEIDRALERQRLDASEEVGFYLVNLLDAFSKSDSVKRYLNEPLALLLHQAVFANPHNRVASYRLLGDVSLYIAGLFAPSLRRRAVDVDYAIKIGSSAYASVSSLTRVRAYRIGGRMIPVLYEEMSEKFPALVEVLTQISDRHALGCDSPDVAELYQRWMRTKGPHLLEQLTHKGALPGALLGKPTAGGD